MELNDIEQTHEHATVSMKVVMLIFAIVLVGALGYLVWQQNSAPDTTDYSSPKTTSKSTATETASKNLVACGDEAYAFELTFGSMWNGHTIKQVNPNYAVITCYVTMPTTSTDSVWTTAAVDHAAYYASIFAVSVYTPAQWATAQEEANKPTKLGENASYVWGWAPAQALPNDLQATNIAGDVTNVVATFKIAV